MLARSSHHVHACIGYHYFFWCSIILGSKNSTNLTACNEHLPQITLVSVGIHEPFESNLKAMQEFAPALGFHKVLSWGEDEFLVDSITVRHRLAFITLERNENESIICRTWAKHCRPYCAAFKPVALLRAFQQMSEGDYVMWADASRYVNYSMLLWQMTATNVTIVDAVTQLGKRYAFQGSPSMYGVAHCYHNNKVCASNGAYLQPAGNVNRSSGPWLDQFELSALQELRPHNACAILNDLWLENPHLLLANMALNHAILLQWLSLALNHPRAFCRSHSQDQAAWSMIVSEHKLPVLAFANPYKMKSLANVLVGLSTGAFNWIDRSVQRTPFARGTSHHDAFGLSETYCAA